MRRWLTTIIVTGLVLGAFTWGYSEWTNRQRLANALESDYQREFYSVLEQVEQLDPLLSKSLVAASSKQQVFYLTEIWSRATASQGALGQLPFLDINLSASRKFLSQMGDYAYSLAKQVAGGREMETEQRKQLQNFSRQVKEYTGPPPALKLPPWSTGAIFSYRESGPTTGWCCKDRMLKETWWTLL
jgi:spore germination protein